LNLPELRFKELGHLREWQHMQQ